MSGHSKWSKVKHQKAGTDAAKSAAFTRASRAISIAVGEGGGISDPDKNFKLRLAIDQAKAVNMPKDTIERAIERAVNKNGAGVERVFYEGYGPGGVAYIVEATTDNRQRTSANIKHQFDRSGGSLGGPGTVMFLFDRLGVLVVTKAAYSYDVVLDAAIDAGAHDVIEHDEVFEIYTDPQSLSTVQKGIVARGFTVENAALIYKTKTKTDVAADMQDQLTRLTEALESLDDVAGVYTAVD